MTRFRPCIDLHEGRVKQIVGGTLKDGATPRTNFVSDRNAAYYANLYRENNLRGGHVILLGPGNKAEAEAALRAFPGGLQIGGGVNAANAKAYLDAGASHVIVTSWLFPENRLALDRLKKLSSLTGADRLVVDLSCRRKGSGWFVAMNRWQTVTDVELEAGLFAALNPFCAEYLIHAADVEGLQQGVDWELVRRLTGMAGRPVTYAGGANTLADLDGMEIESGGLFDLTIGSALDIFGGEVRFQDCVAWNKTRR